MDFRLNDEQELFVDGVRELMASENWEAYFAQCDRESKYPERFVKALADMEIDNLLIPEEHGGLNAGFVTVAAIWMELGRLGAPTYVLYQLPGDLTPYCVKGLKNKSTKSWRFVVQANRCGTQRSLNRGLALMWAAYKPLIPVKMAKFTSTVANALSPVVLIPLISS